MKIEKLNDNSLKRRKFLYTLICVVLLLIIISLFVSHAKYRNIQSVQVATGSINYSGADFNLVAVNIRDSEGESYKSIDTIPESGYKLTSYKCEVSGKIDSNVTVEYNNGEIAVSGITKKGTKCTVYFDKIIPIANIILANNTVSTRSSFSSPYTTNTSASSNSGKGIIFSAADDDGTSYYFAGASPDNWVSFANFYWRIIRINGDGTIRLIYNGTSTSTTGSGTQLSNTSAYNDSWNENDYVGYMYTKNSVHGTGTDSTIKGVVDSWYVTNIVGKKDTNNNSYSTYVDSNGGFCNDRYPSTSDTSSNGSGGTGTTTTYYAAYIRLITNKAPSLKCQTSSDLFTVSGAVKSDGSTSKGNGALTFPVGLITADEVSYAGGIESTYNESYWLYTDSAYWTMSPRYFHSYGGSDGMFLVYSDGSLLDVFEGVGTTSGVRPVINLRVDTIFSSGNGTSSNPYVVKTS